MPKKSEKAIWLRRPDRRDRRWRRFDLIYAGDEHCSRFALSLKTLAGMLERAASCGKRLVYVTPLETDATLRQREGILRYLARRHRGCEIVVNDLGLLRLIKRRYDAFTLTAGRLLVRQLAYPDFTIVSKKSAVRFLRAHGINRVEVAYRPGLLLPADPDPPEVSVHYPYFPIALTRFCPFHKKYRDEKKAPCRACGERFVPVRHPYVEERLYVRGNATFLKYSCAQKTLRSLPVSRLVYQPDA